MVPLKRAMVTAMTRRDDECLNPRRADLTLCNWINPSLARRLNRHDPNR